MARGERLDLAEDRVVPSERQLGVDALLERGQPQLLDPRDLGASEALELHVGERRPAPERERLAQGGRALGRVERAGRVERPLEAQRVDAFGIDVQPVARRARLDRFAADDVAQVRDAVLKRRIDALRRSRAPDLVDQPVGRDDLVRHAAEAARGRRVASGPRSAAGGRPTAPRVARGAGIPWLGEPNTAR